MKKIIFLFLMFSAIVFAEWKVSAGSSDDGTEVATFFTTYDYETESFLSIGVVLEDYDGYSFIMIKNKKMMENDYLTLIIKDNEGDTINYQFTDGDIYEQGGAFIGSKQGDLLTKMLYKGQSAILYNNDTDEVLASFDLKGLQKVMKKHVGSSSWYRYKLNSIYD